jgi:hypothetical protein
MRRGQRPAAGRSPLRTPQGGSTRTARAYELRREAEALSPEYVAWLATGRQGPEPLVRREVSRRILEIADEQDRLLEESG